MRFMIIVPANQDSEMGFLPKNAQLDGGDVVPGFSCTLVEIL
jgi:hypothetical protein